MNNEIWRMDSNWLLAYTEDPNVVRKIKRSYPQFLIHAEYFKNRKRIAVIYKIPNEKKRTIRRMMGGIPLSA